MWPFKPKRTLKDVKTEVGNAILKDLKSDGWHVISEYSNRRFDKGIDFDAYTLKRGKDKVVFEWDNWMEWTISGPAEIITSLVDRYTLLPPQRLQSE